MRTLPGTAGQDDIMAEAATRFRRTRPVPTKVTVRVAHPYFPGRLSTSHVITMAALLAYIEVNGEPISLL